MLCINLTPEFGAPVSELIPMCRQVGFDGFFTGWVPDMAEEWARLASENRLIYQSLHAPFDRVADIWHDDKDAAGSALRILTDCCEGCARIGVPVMVTHAYIGDFNKVGIPNEMGIERFERLVRRAEELGVKIAFENTEGEEYLFALLDAFKDRSSVGFCLDTGHERCYSYGKDLLERYGDRLIATHINDNLGVSRADGSIYWDDDLHLLPFDGIIDWDEFGARLRRCGYSAPLTFELKTVSKPGRHENDTYSKMGALDFLTAAYSRACKVAEKFKSNN